MVAGLADSVEDVLSPSSTLGDSDAFNSRRRRARRRLRPGRPSSTSCRLLELVESFPQARERPRLPQREAVPRPPRLLRARHPLRWRPSRAQDGARPSRCAGGDRRWTPERPRRWSGNELAGAGPVRSGTSGRGRHRPARGRAARARRWSAGRGSPSACSPKASLPTPRARRRPGASPRRPLRRQGGGHEGAGRAGPAAAGDRGRRAAGARRRGCGCTVAPPRSPPSEGVELQVSLTHSRELAAAVVVAGSPLASRAVAAARITLRAEMEAWLEPIYDAAGMRAADAWAIEEQRVPSLELMETAGAAVAEAARSAARPGPARVVCGKGNNGGDGLVAARQLADTGYEVEALLLWPAAELSPDATRQPGAIRGRRRRAGPGEVAAALEGSGVVVDAIFGTGFSGRRGRPRTPRSRRSTAAARRSWRPTSPPASMRRPARWRARRWRPTSR